MNKMTCDVIRSFLTQDLKYDVIMRLLRRRFEQVFDEERREPLAFEEETLLFSVGERNLH